MSQSSPKGTPFRLWLILGNFEQIKFLKFSQKTKQNSVFVWFLPSPGGRIEHKNTEETHAVTRAMCPSERWATRWRKPSRLATRASPGPNQYFEHFLNVVCELHTRFQTLWHHNHSFVNSHHLNSTLNALQSVLRTINAIPNVPVPSSWLRKLSSSGHDFESTFLRFAKGKSDSKKYPNFSKSQSRG